MKLAVNLIFFAVGHWWGTEKVPSKKMSGFYAKTVKKVSKLGYIGIRQVASSPTSGAIPVIMAVRIHLFPFRTQKLSSLAPRVLAHYGLGE